jgi:(Z)-2-((N-methylformamido)methylene)-5-hydroxybutyrolactone dehydrogenase
VRAARAAFDRGPWRRTTGAERARLMRRLAELIADNAERIAVVESTDNGKLIREMEGQLRSLADYYHYFAGAADKIGGETLPADRPNFFIYTLREPVGVVGAITPWNSPVLLMSWKLAPALAAGCTFVVKPAEQAPASTLEFAELVEQAGFPPGVFNVITGFGEDAGAALVEHPGVDKVAFTGSTEVGRAVMRGAAGHLARVSLELGGKSPHIVFADADLEAAANGVVAGIFAATGQTCMAGSRLFVQDEVHDELLERLASRARDIRLGDPLEAATEMGPVAFLEHRENVEARIGRAEAEGARLVTGGHRPSDDALRDGFFVEPTIFADVAPEMDIAREEVFGPVLSVQRFSD